MTDQHRQTRTAGSMHAITKLSGVLMAGGVAMALSGQAMAAVSAPALSYDPADADIEAGTWANEQGNSDYIMQLGPNASKDAVNDSAAPGITSAVTQPAGETLPLASEDFPGGDPLTGSFHDLTVELWIRASDFNGEHVLFETGGSGAGLSIELDDDELKFNTTNEQPQVTATLDAGLAGQFIQVVAVLDRDGNGDNDNHALYVNGSQVGTSSLDSGAAPGPNGTGIGAVNGTYRGTLENPTSFDGEFGAVRIWDSELFAEDVEELYTTVVPEPGSMSLLGLGGLLMWRRRR